MSYKKILQMLRNDAADALVSYALVLSIFSIASISAFAYFSNVVYGVFTSYVTSAQQYGTDPSMVECGSESCG